MTLDVVFLIWHAKNAKILLCNDYGCHVYLDSIFLLLSCLIYSFRYNFPGSVTG